MSDEEIYKRVEHISSFEVPNGYVIEDQKRDAVIFLNLTAATILELCDGINDVAQIADLMKEAYNLSASPYDDVEACVRQLCLRGLIEPSMSPQQFGLLSFLRRLVRT